MKNILLVTALCFLIFPVSKAQTTKGKTLIGISTTMSMAGTGSNLMSMGFSTVKYKSDTYEDSDPVKTTNINFSPKAGYFVADNFCLGLDFNYAFSGEKNEGDVYESKYNQSLFSVGPFIRYYIPGGKVLPFFELSGTLGSLTSKYKSDDYNETYKTGVKSFGAGVGAAFPVGEKVIFDLIGGYNSLTLKDKEDNPDNEKNVIGTFGIKLGIVVLLGSTN